VFFYQDNGITACKKLKKPIKNVNDNLNVNKDSINVYSDDNVDENGYNKWNDYFNDETYNLDPCSESEKISEVYNDNNKNQTSICNNKIKDIYDEKVDQMSNYTTFKTEYIKNVKDNINPKGHLGNIVNTDHWSYENESSISGGAIYKYNDTNDIHAYDTGLSNELAL
jgi:hypothetical protein